jgi:hypothetical protein
MKNFLLPILATLALESTAGPVLNNAFSARQQKTRNLLLNAANTGAADPEGIICFRTSLLLHLLNLTCISSIPLTSPLSTRRQSFRSPRRLPSSSSPQTRHSLHRRRGRGREDKNALRSLQGTKYDAKIPHR